MDKSMIAILLKDRRSLCNLSAAEVVQKLSAKGITLSEKTLYGYENGVSLPNVPTFIALCDIYEIDDILGEASHPSTELTVASACTDDWNIDQYNDFFNADLYGKILLLLKWGIPSFSGYEKQLNDTFYKNSRSANEGRLLSLFSMLNESGQGHALSLLESVAREPAFLRDNIRPTSSTGRVG